MVSDFYKASQKQMPEPMNTYQAGLREQRTGRPLAHQVSPEQALNPASALYQNRSLASFERPPQHQPTFMEDPVSNRPSFRPSDVAIENVYSKRATSLFSGSRFGGNVHQAIGLLL